MNADFRVSTTVFENLKIRKLKRRLGAGGLLALFQLWAYVATQRPDGNLSGMDANDIEEVANWDGEQGAFYCALVDLKFIDEAESDYCVIHDWIKHNGWVAGSNARSDAARLLRYARENKTNHKALMDGEVVGLSAGEYHSLCSGGASVDDILHK